MQHVCEFTSTLNRFRFSGWLGDWSYCKPLSAVMVMYPIDNLPLPLIHASARAIMEDTLNCPCYVNQDDQEQKNI